MQIDLHGYHPAEIVWSGVLAKIVEQAWEMGERELILIHGHGRNRGITPGFVNTNTGFFGLQIRSALRHDKDLRRWIHHTTLDCSKPGLTRVSLKPNRSPIRTSLDLDLLPEPIRSIIPHDEPAKYMRPEVMTAIIDEVLPEADRGKLLLGVVTKAGCNDLETDDYENVTIYRFRHRCLLPNPEIEGRQG